MRKRSRAAVERPSSERVASSSSATSRSRTPTNIPSIRTTSSRGVPRDRSSTARRITPRAAGPLQPFDLGGIDEGHVDALDELHDRPLVDRVLPSAGRTWRRSP